MVKIHQHVKFQAIPSMRSLANARKHLRTDGRTCRKTVTVGRVDQRTHVQVKRGYFRLRTDGGTDGQPENIMPPAPKGGGITNNCHGPYFNIYILFFFLLFKYPNDGPFFNDLPINNARPTTLSLRPSWYLAFIEQSIICIINLLIFIVFEYIHLEVITLKL